MSDISLCKKKPCCLPQLHLCRQKWNFQIPMCRNGTLRHTVQFYEQR